MDVEDHEHRRLIFINMKQILTPEEKQYLRRTANYLGSLGMREGYIEIELEQEADKITMTAIVIIGDVIKPKSYEYSKLYDKTFSHGFRGSRDVATRWYFL